MAHQAYPRRGNFALFAQAGAMFQRTFVWFGLCALKLLSDFQIERLGLQQVILQYIPSGLRSEVAMIVCKSLVKKVPLFEEVSEGFVESLVTYLQPEVFLAGEVIVKEGMLAREMYFLNTVKQDA